jgi:hypothetical protein
MSKMQPSNDRPYTQTGSETALIRTFSEDVQEFELVWHRDREDRIVTPLHNTDWKFQLDNDIPRVLKEEIFIPKETYHRLIKGTGNLKVNIVKL